MDYRSRRHVLLDLFPIPIDVYLCLPNCKLYPAKTLKVNLAFRKYVFRKITALIRSADDAFPESKDIWEFDNIETQ